MAKMCPKGEIDHEEIKLCKYFGINVRLLLLKLIQKMCQYYADTFLHMNNHFVLPC
jgi:hypothetical protein